MKNIYVSKLTTEIFSSVHEEWKQEVVEVLKKRKGTSIEEIFSDFNRQNISRYEGSN